MVTAGCLHRTALAATAIVALTKDISTIGEAGFLCFRLFAGSLFSSYRRKDSPKWQTILDLNSDLFPVSEIQGRLWCLSPSD
jgi:hypothetical protein